MGQNIVALLSMLFIFAVVFHFSPIMAVLLAPIWIVLGISLWKL